MGMTEGLRWAAAELMGLGKFAVDSAVNESLKGGMQVYAIVKGKSQSQPISDKSNGDKKQNLVLAQEMQAKLDKMQQDINIQQQQSKMSALRKEEQEHPKQLLDDNPLSRRKIFIRSRL